MSPTRPERWLRRSAGLAGALALGVAAPACDIGDPATSDAADIPGANNPALYLSALVSEGAILRADINGDGIVDIADLIIVAQSFGDVSTDVTSLVTIVDEGIRWVPGRGPTTTSPCSRGSSPTRSQWLTRPGRRGPLASSGSGTTRAAS